MRPLRCRFGLASAAVIAVFVTAWLTLSVPTPHSLAQDSPPGTPEQQGQSPIGTPEGELATDTATPTPTPTETPVEPPTATPTETPSETPSPPAEPAAETPTPPLAEPSTEAPAPTPEEGATSTPEPAASPQGIAPGEQATESVEITPETATPTPRPIAFPSPTPTPNVLVLMDRALTGLLGAAAWIWFVCGSLLFFVVAGIVAGLGFYRRERNRYRLYELSPDEEMPAQSQDQTGEDDDAWPPSLL